MTLTLPERIAKMFHALGHLTRQQLMLVLAEHKPVSLAYLAKRVNTTDPNASFHMKVLVDAGLVDRQDVGRYTSFRSNRDGLVAVQAFSRMLLNESPTNETLRNKTDSPSA